MARKKFVDENNEDQENANQTEGKPQAVKYSNYSKKNVGPGLLLGGGAKNRNKSLEYHHSKNLDEAYGCVSVSKQLSSLGLTIREMPGDGNCLFRALSDQITGSSRNHLEYRRAVVQYMKDFRADFEPFVEDDVPFDKYVQRLSQAGTFAGNDAIVAFARLHNVSVVIHQLNLPTWVIHPSKETHEHHSGREVHIFYHNGDHYNSVRRAGDDTDNPTSIKLHAQANSNPKASFNKAGKKSPPHSSRGTKSSTCANTNFYDPVAYGYESYGHGRDEDFWVKDTQDVDRIVEEVMQKTNYPDPNLVKETLLDYNFDVVATTDFIISVSFMMNQHHERPPDPCKNKDEIPSDLETYQQDLTKKCEKEREASELDFGAELCALPSLNKEVQDLEPSSENLAESDNDSVMPPDGSGSDESSHEELCSSQSNESEANPTMKKEPRLSAGRQKKKQKRDRKRDAVQRKKNVELSEIDGDNTVVISNLGSLDI